MHPDENAVGGKPHFDLSLPFRPWQGSGRFDTPPPRAAATAAVCARHAPRVDVPLSDAGGYAHGVNAWPALFAQFRAAQDLLRQHAPERVLTAGGDCAADIASIG